MTIDAKGRLSLREELARGVPRRPRKHRAKLGRGALRALLGEARAAGFFELEERYVEPGEGKPTFRIAIASGPTRGTVTVYGTPPAAFTAVVDAVERLYGKPLLPGLPRPGRRVEPLQDSPDWEKPDRYPEPGR